MEKENLYGVMEISMTANGRIIKNMAMELTLDRIMINMKDTFRTINSTGKELNTTAIMMSMKEIG